VLYSTAIQKISKNRESYCNYLRQKVFWPREFVWCWLVFRSFKLLLQLRFDFDSTLIRLRFDYDSTTTIAIKITIRLRFDFDSTCRSGHHDSMLMKAQIHTRQHFTSEVCKKAIPTSTIERCYPMFIRQRECHRDVHYIINAPTAAFLLATTPLDATKKWTFSFFVVVESKSNRNCNSRFTHDARCDFSEVRFSRNLPEMPNVTINIWKVKVNQSSRWKLPYWKSCGCIARPWFNYAHQINIISYQTIW